MTAIQRLIAAMHTAGGSKGHYVASWHSLAQKDDALREAVRAVFGKKFPTLQKLGVWLNGHIGVHGALFLEGKTKPLSGDKGWAYRVRDLEAEKVAAAVEEKRVAELRQEAAKRDAEIVAQFARKPEPKEGDVVTTPDGQRYLLGRVRIDEQGRTTQERIPLPAKSEAPAAVPTPTQKHDGRPPWLQRGELKPRDREEWERWQGGRGAALQLPREAPPQVLTPVWIMEQRHPTEVELKQWQELAHAPSATPVVGFANPGGVVAQNVFKERMGDRPHVHVARGLVPWKL